MEMQVRDAFAPAGEELSWGIQKFTRDDSIQMIYTSDVKVAADLQTASHRVRKKN